jgi:hypothetical protein
MTAKEKELAKRFAASIKEHERRNDYGGTRQQDIRDFKEQVWANRSSGSGYVMPSGRLTKDLRKAVEAWANS